MHSCRANPPLPSKSHPPAATSSGNPETNPAFSKSADAIKRYRYSSRRSTRIERLKELCHAPSDADLIDRIEEQRAELLRGTASPSDPSHHTARQKEQLHLNDLVLSLRMDLAPASLDTLLDLLVDKAHMQQSCFCAPGKQNILDIGANEGFYSLLLWQQNPEVRILAVEPASAAFALLKENIELNRAAREQWAGIQPVQKAAGSFSGTTELETYPGVSTISSGRLSLLEQDWIDPGRIEKEQVRSVTLDRLIRQQNFQSLDLMKIDVEGGELEVLQGAEQTLAVTSRIIIEWHTEDLKQAVVELLQSRGFRLVRAETNRFGDLYFEKTGSNLI
ncbi:MAG: FkbM family methyltransferase [Spirochaetales bacterium]|nr:FkbM family methyltransferase [Spirochaetales bacterium]MCF7939724.1 FkbM family methyltransferase [Spirochaetales bacterium]